ncbi:YciE/YciF ferroxidase family protein [Pinibacter aurantiacus]|uniref:Ferritin-like domain-containing protein n=1 Tax=Pinibacter aurantiacus TaxID=2851599 RepID=A0A9E2SC31_9BACT|nr:ferritin-like domain-containing protein [Pinibacter aurantiacus]MBV4360338.1 ferritin-like domain-containing protein [Pinibacter aurantiacus]
MEKTTKSANGKAATSTATRKTSSSKNKTVKSMLADFFVEEIKDIYWAEKHIVKALPKMQKAANSDELANAFSEHLKQTEGHVTRLERVFELLGESPKAKKCDAMEGILKEGESIIEETEEGTSTRDVGLILAAQKVEHYEITTYGSLHQLATTMGKNDVADLLAQTLQEEKNTDKLLTKIAEAHINNAAEDEEE